MTDKDKAALEAVLHYLIYCQNNERWSGSDFNVKHVQHHIDTIKRVMQTSA
ncbi:MAG: hypothetical protein QF569_23540 [Candidatus Poribacteria bacterium]|jgi:hypothetical protein|nr:hypothetical protein [Candidatus Poribacteria bacterium]